MEYIGSMNSLIENNFIKEMACGSNFAYVLSDNSTFLSTEYKVLQSQTDSCFVKCMKMSFNGQTQLYYVTKALKPFSAMISSLDPDSFLTIVSNLLSDIIDVKHNGFLSCQNIDISFERIYVDPTTFKVSLVYVPLSKRMYEDNSSFENDLRTGLVKLISGIGALSSPRTIQLSADLSDGTLSLEDLHNRTKGGKQIINRGLTGADNSGGISTSTPGGAAVNRGMLRVIALNAPTRVEIAVTKDSFVLGSKAGMCDGIIGFNKMISRSHCMIRRNGNSYTVTDLHSSNGTYVNKVRLQPDVPYPIKNGDIIRLANSDFQVSMA